MCGAAARPLQEPDSADLYISSRLPLHVTATVATQGQAIIQLYSHIALFAEPLDAENRTDLIIIGSLPSLTGYKLYLWLKRSQLQQN